MVNSATVIAHAILGLDVANLSPASLLSGRQFELAQISGVVEADFFDWLLEVPGGEAFIRTVARRLARFEWQVVDHDVLKTLYESVIGPETRRRLGEYYTPEWLAQQMVATVVTDPLEQRILDPACGSGTFLFHAARAFLTAAAEAALPLAEALDRLTNHVQGVDLHPVAVSFARVTYLLAIGQQLLTDPSRGPIRVPVYLGDSMQWQQRLDLLTADHLVVPVEDEVELFASELRFPDHLLADQGRFDALVIELADLASRRQKGGQIPALGSVFRRHAIRPEGQPSLTATFGLLCRLHDEGRNHIWGYYVRNLARPLWLSRLENRVDAVIGNPPWLAYRYMASDMQRSFREMCGVRGLWHGASVATNQDLSALFVARVVQLYLRPGGRFAFVMPNAALDRRQFAGFRTGRFSDHREPTRVTFERPWDLRRLRPHFFPRAASVVFGRRAGWDEPSSAELPDEAEQWRGRIDKVNASWEEARNGISREVAGTVVSGQLARSPYHARFAQGATVVPRALFVVEEQAAGPLGIAAGGRAVRSAKSAYEKPPWRDLPRLEGIVEADFIRPLYLGESVLPFRLLPALRCVVPWNGERLLNGEDPRIDMYPRVAAWWREAERLWLANRSSDRLSLLDRLDYRAGFRHQFPVTGQRIVYAKAGMHLAAARVTDLEAVIDHKLYWAIAGSDEEALYLCSILNSPTVTERVRPLMAYGKDERDIDMAVWRLPVPIFDPARPEHQRLVTLGRLAEGLAARLTIDEGKYFSALRRQIRGHLAESEIGGEIDELVEWLLALT